MRASILAVGAAFAAGAAGTPSIAAEPPVALVGATLVDVTDWGRSTGDLVDSVIVIRGDRFLSAGRRGEVEIPEGAEVRDASGSFAVPGLIDAFAALNDQSYASAYLYEGVTSIVGVSSARRGELFLAADPGPHVYPLQSIGYDAKPLAEHLRDLETIHARGARVALLMYQLTPEQLAALVLRARELGLATVGELGHSRYADGGAAGLDAFVHTTRYSLDLAPEAMRRAVADHPFSDDLDSPKWRYYFFLTGLAEDDPRVTAHAERLAASGAALMPTAALLYLDQDWARNPWREPVARLLDPAAIDNPADPETGRHTHPESHARAYAAVAEAEVRLERAYRRAGSRYLAGSGTDVWGTMPGLSLHQELELLVRAFGLTPREALAAATDNVSRVFRWQELGRISPGRRADLLLLRADPRLDVRNLRRLDAVFLAGVEIGRESLLQP